MKYLEVLTQREYLEAFWSFSYHASHSLSCSCTGHVLMSELEEQSAGRRFVWRPGKAELEARNPRLMTSLFAVCSAISPRLAASVYGGDVLSAASVWGLGFKAHGARSYKEPLSLNGSLRQ